MFCPWSAGRVSLSCCRGKGDICREIGRDNGSEERRSRATPKVQDAYLSLFEESMMVLKSIRSISFAHFLPLPDAERTAKGGSRNVPKGHALADAGGR